ncbi:hypothetical protein CXG81DRAFT_28608 [Caulochytrium protostelioides]|uniref:Ysc84 actin-binding domain-containing protein n=1 Tax=Caulochytrium protostelioides TaxID=1555241 RepID=A0A4P9X2C5_9FUNG|nr:hypothetical protein CXG81DRAFT_28608 [Caulochytrium protostelioides]|eukprot:RKO98570.1 hypothetical protein CXG81DRAFT_28608 [Caulochytrium protostelioides]
MAAPSRLTAGEECQQAAKTLSAFIDASCPAGAIPGAFIGAAMGIAIVRGENGVAVVRLASGAWSAPCAFSLLHPTGHVQDGQETVLCFMSERAVIALASRSPIVFGETHTFMPGPLQGGPATRPQHGVDVYVWVRFNGGYTPPALIAQHMARYVVQEDSLRHERWHGTHVTWGDVLTNRITVDRSSVGNALYLVLNLAVASTAGSASGHGGGGGGMGMGTGMGPGGRNWADLEKLAIYHAGERQAGAGARFPSASASASSSPLPSASASQPSRASGRSPHETYHGGAGAGAGQPRSSVPGFGRVSPSSVTGAPLQHASSQPFMHAPGRSAMGATAGSMGSMGSPPPPPPPPLPSSSTAASMGIHVMTGSGGPMMSTDPRAMYGTGMGMDTTMGMQPGMSMQPGMGPATMGFPSQGQPYDQYDQPSYSQPQLQQPMSQPPYSHQAPLANRMPYQAPSNNAQPPAMYPFGP